MFRSDNRELRFVFLRWSTVLSKNVLTCSDLTLSIMITQTHPTQTIYTYKVTYVNTLHSFQIFL